MDRDRSVMPISRWPMLSNRSDYINGNGRIKFTLSRALSRQGRGIRTKM
jgi:hypothetical protein